MRSYNTVLPTSLIRSKDLRDEYKIFYAILSYLTGENGYCWHKNESLAEEACKDERSVRRALAALEKAGYILIDRNISKTNPLYSDNAKLSYRKRVIWLKERYLFAKDQLKIKRKEAKAQSGQMSPEEFKEHITKTRSHLDYFMTAQEAYGSAKYGINEDGLLYTIDTDHGDVYYLSEAKTNEIWQRIYNDKRIL